jgi:threonine dehydrogenase-like Zn-dependent dehydrogenase
MLVYRGEASPDDLLPAGSEGSFAFPIKYGTSASAGWSGPSGVGSAVGDRVFARHPHQDLFTLDARDPAALVPIPDSVGDEFASFFNLTKVALTALLEVPVRVGDVAVIFGQGVIGLLLTQLVRRTPAT